MSVTIQHTNPDSSSETNKKHHFDNLLLYIVALLGLLGSIYLLIASNKYLNNSSANPETPSSFISESQPVSYLYSEHISDPTTFQIEDDINEC